MVFFLHRLKKVGNTNLQFDPGNPAVVGSGSL